MMFNFVALEQTIKDQMQTSYLPGLALAIIHDLELIYAKGFGVTSVEDCDLPVTPQTLFRIGSVTKPLTGTAVMRLVDVGLLDLDQPIVSYLPKLTLSDVTAPDIITLRMLLSHTAGLTTSSSPYGRREPDGLDIYIHSVIGEYPFVAPPDTLFSYSNPGIRLAGYIAQQVAEKPYVQLMKDVVFDPLGMHRTTFDLTVAMTYPLAQSHDLGPDNKLSVQHRFGDNTRFYPSGSCISTACDLARFAIMQMNCGMLQGKQFLSAEAVADMQRKQVDMYTTPRAGYGLTFFTDEYKGLDRVGHEGYYNSFGCRLMMIPETGTAVVLLVNRAGGFWHKAIGLVDRIADELLGLPSESQGSQHIEPDRSLWPLYSGSFLGDWRGFASIAVLDGVLTLNWNGEAMPLQAISPNHYFAPGTSRTGMVGIGFILNDSEPVDYILIQGEPLRRVDLNLPESLDPGMLASYAGTYVGAKTVMIGNQGTDLVAISDDYPFHGKVHCIPLSDTLFACDYGTIEFGESDDDDKKVIRIHGNHILTRLE